MPVTKNNVVRREVKDVPGLVLCLRQQFFEGGPYLTVATASNLNYKTGVGVGVGVWGCLGGGRGVSRI